MAETIRDIKNERNKIGEFQNPEELAKALEEKSKQDLAKRVREISGQVQDTSVDLRKKLQDQLSDIEQSQIRKTLPDKGVDNVFVKGMTQEERQELMAKRAVAGAIGVEAASGLGKLESWGKSISDSFDVAGELFEKGQFMAALGVILKGLFGQFSLAEWNKKDDEKKENGEKSGDKIDKISPAMKMIVSYSYKGDKDSQEKIINISQTDNFKNLSLKEINDLSQNENGLKDWSKKTYPNGGVDLKYVKELFQLFSSSGNGYKTLKNINKYGFDENKKIIEVLTPSKENKDMYIYEKFSNLDAFSLTDGVGEFIKFDTESLKKGEFISNGINANILTFILSNPFKLGDNIETLLANKSSSINEDENKKVREIIDFGNKINNLLKTNKTINLGTDIDLTGTLDLKDITKLFIMLGGETDFNKMNEFQQSFLYFTIPGFLGEKGSWGNIDEGGYTAKLGIKIKDATLNKANELPEGVNRFFSNVGNKIIDSSIEFLKSFGLKVTGGASEVIKEYPWLVPLMISLVLIYPFAERKTILGAILKKKGVSKK